ncbi:enolase C-terminal domain-like protein [Streptomyces sp. NBC_01477]|uniref:enolase C-terminal domain-like protein n=1 Tax=Streptomyces sp. NBC_01477 TaxID=2976015 RepID=UPI002E349FDE|nr:enolase C-terminal domain-like protein [Streptomyces sp. NBC_01477]
MSGGIRITGADITPVAFRDPALLNAVGVHEPYALRAIVEVRTDQGITGLGETYADGGHLRRLRAAVEVITGMDVHTLGGMHRRISEALNGGIGAGGHGLTGSATGSGAADRVFAPFEVACLDIQGKAAGLPVSDLLGGAVRECVPFGAHLFYKRAGHPGREPDEWGAALDPDGIVAQARRMTEDYGFGAITLKGGVMPPEEEVEAVRALHKAFPGIPLRLDPNAAWTVETSVRVARELDGVLEYLADPTPGQRGMAEVARRAPMPLASTMCVAAFDELSSAVARESVRIVLADHHSWGGLQRSLLLAGICRTFGLGLSLHSDSHLGVGLAAMTHLAAATPDLAYACGTRWPWKSEEVVVPGALAFADGAVRVPTAPGLGVELDRDALARLHEQYVTRGLREPDGTGRIRRIDPSYERRSPRR